MEDLLLPFRKGKRDQTEKKEQVRDRIGESIAASHKAKTRMRQSDIEFEKAFEEVMGPSAQKKKPITPKKVMIIGKKPKPAEKGEVKVTAKKPGPKEKPAEAPEAKETPAEKKPGKKWNEFGFWFCGIKASSRETFKDAIKKIPEKSLNHHAAHNDFSKYLRQFYDKKTAGRVEELENMLKGEDLRQEILKALA